MNFKEKLRKVLQLLDLSQKAKDKQLTSEDVASIATRYQKEFQATLREDMDADSKQPMSQEEMNQLQSLLAGIVPAETSEAQVIQKMALFNQKLLPKVFLSWLKTLRNRMMNYRS